jgi:hypothetical protein
MFTFFSFAAPCSQSSVLQLPDQRVVLIVISARTQPKALSERGRTAEQKGRQKIQIPPLVFRHFVLKQKTQSVSKGKGHNLFRKAFHQLRRGFYSILSFSVSNIALREGGGVSGWEHSEQETPPPHFFVILQAATCTGQGSGT